MRTRGGLAGRMREDRQSYSSFKAWLLAVCLGLFMHSVWLTTQTEVNLLDHMARGDVSKVFSLDHDHDHHDHGAPVASFVVNADNPLDLHHHHHFSESTPSIVPRVEQMVVPLSVALIRDTPGNVLAPDGVRPSGPFQPPRA